MEIREINIIKKDLKNIDDIINDLKKNINDSPNDYGLKTDLISFESRRSEVLRELSFAKEDKKLAIFDFKITDNQGVGSNIDLSSAGDIFKSVQETVTSFVMAIYNPIKKKTSISEHIKLESMLKIDSVQTSSLEVVVSQKNPQTTIDDSMIKQALKNLNNAIDCGKNKEKILLMTEKVGNQPMFRYKELLKNVKNHNINLSFYENVVPEGFNQIKITNNFATDVFQIMDTSNDEIKNLKIEGFLYYINVRSKKFGIENDEGSKFNIYFDDEFKNEIKEKIDSNVRVELEEKIIYKEIEDEKNSFYKLLKLF